MNKSSSNSQKFRLERTKDFYDDLRKLQTTFHRDEITREEQIILAKLDITKRDLEQELALNRANITEIEKE